MKISRKYIFLIIIAMIGFLMSICIFFDCNKVFQWIGNLGVGVFSSTLVVIFLERINDKNNFKILENQRVYIFSSFKRDLIYTLKTELECTSEYLLLNEEIEKEEVKINIKIAVDYLINNFDTVEKYYFSRRSPLRINHDFINKSKKESYLLCDIPVHMYKILYKDISFLEEHLVDYFLMGVINQNQYEVLLGVNGLIDEVIRYSELGINEHINVIEFDMKRMLLKEIKSICELFNLNDDIVCKIAKEKSCIKKN
ncbi:MAG: hypothetical protein MSH40_00845 [Christensenella sp.]|nr:hypothetical protein [Christensenella sp.]